MHACMQVNIIDARRETARHIYMHASQLAVLDVRSVQAAT